MEEIKTIGGVVAPLKLQYHVQTCSSSLGLHCNASIDFGCLSFPSSLFSSSSASFLSLLLYLLTALLFSAPFCFIFLFSFAYVNSAPMTLETATVAEKTATLADQRSSPSSTAASHSSPIYHATSNEYFHSTPQTKLRYRQLVPPITPTELEPLPGTEGEDWEEVENDQLEGGRHSSSLRPPRLELSSLDLAKPRIYTRLLYFFEAPPTSQPSQQDMPPSTGSQQQSASSSPTTRSKKSKAKAKARRYDHYNQTAFMDPMLLEASLALVLTDFFPLAGRVSYEGIYDNNSSNSSGLYKRPYIECNDRGVLFTVADTTITMDRIRRGDYQDSILPPQLFPVGLYPASLRDPPLLAIQLTYTQDKSLIMGVAMDSSIMDATSLVSFMEAWSRITQGKDFAPFPVLNRSFLLQPVVENGSAGVYRHQRVNHSPPPPILYDNYLDNHAEAAVEESNDALDEEDEDDREDELDEEDNDDDDDGDDNGTNLELAHKRLQSLQLESSTVTSETEAIPRVVLDDIELEFDGQEGRNYQEGEKLHVFHFSNAQLERIKKLASEQNIAAAACAADDKEISDKWVSTGDSLIAYLWKMSTIARRMEPDCKLMCGVVMDIRKRITPEVAEGYIGNAIL